jgi:sodium/proline symporter
MLAFALYAGVLLIIGYLASKKMHDIRDYFASGKRLGFINVAFSSRATGESAWLLLGLTGSGYLYGAKAFWVVLGEMLGVGIAWIFMAKRFKRLTDKYDSITVPDFLESRLRDPSHWLRLIACGTLLIFVPIYAGTQVFAAGGAFHSFLGWNHYVGAAIGFGVVLLYITQGGFTAVVWSDVFQGSLMMLGLVALPIVGLLEAGGVTNIIESLRGIDPNLLTLHGPEHEVYGLGWTPLNILSIVGLAMIGIGFLGSPQVFVRFISIKSEKEILPGTIVALAWTLLADGGAVLVGIVGRVLFSPADLGTADNFHESILPVMSDTLLPAFFSGLYIAMVLSAIMSTIDSLLVVASSAAVRDYWQKTRHPDMADDTLMSLSKKLTVVLALIAFAIGIGIMLYDIENGVFWLIIFGWSGIAATFCPTIVLSLFWSKLTALGSKCSMIAGFCSVPLFEFAAPPLLDALGMDALRDGLFALKVLPPSFAVGMIVAIVVSLADRAGQAKVEGVAAELRAR